MRARTQRALSCTDLENRYGPLGPSRVQIPPPPLSQAEFRVDERESGTFVFLLREPVGRPNGALGRPVKGCWQSRGYRAGMAGDLLQVHSRGCHSLTGEACSCTRGAPSGASAPASRVPRATPAATRWPLLTSVLLTNSGTWRRGSGAGRSSPHAEWLAARLGAALAHPF